MSERFSVLWVASDCWKSDICVTTILWVSSIPSHATIVPSIVDTIWELQWENCWFEWNVFWLDLWHWWFNCQNFLPDLISQKTHSTFAHPLVLLESLCWCEIKIALKKKIVLPQFWASSNLENISHSFLTSMAGCNASFAGNSATQAL